MIWLGWITMRGDDQELDRVLTNPKRRTRLHAFPDGVQRTAFCGVRRPTEDNHLGLVHAGEGTFCERCRMTGKLTLDDVLGRVREVTRTYEDGSFDCPFCTVAVVAPDVRCQNPGCPASVHAMGNPTSQAVFQAQAVQQAVREADEQRRQRDHAAAMARIAAEGAERAQRIQAAREEAQTRGACTTCLWPKGAAGYGQPRYVRHRGPCPRAGG